MIRRYYGSRLHSLTTDLAMLLHDDLTPSSLRDLLDDPIMALLLAADGLEEADVWHAVQRALAALGLDGTDIASQPAAA